MNPAKSKDAISKARTLGAAVGQAGGSPEEAIADELEAYVKQRVREEVEAYKRLHASATSTASDPDAAMRQQEAINTMYTQASSYKGVGSMATVLDDGRSLHGKADSGAIQIIALALGLDDPANSRLAIKKANENAGIFTADDPF